MGRPSDGHPSARTWSGTDPVPSPGTVTRTVLCLLQSPNRRVFTSPDDEYIRPDPDRLTTRNGGRPTDSLIAAVASIPAQEQ
ncbi:hypothetical protein MJO29_006685 [Puccinia striiformis f. sp. tritici]|nr:hypothetical protein MJO29_006685 [Puccinia striiformis f. sp. tritici]